MPPASSRIFLEPHQVELLRSLVEAHRRIKPVEEFLWIDTSRAVPEAPVSHSGLQEPLMAVEADLRALERLEFIDRKPMTQGYWMFSVTPDAVNYYEVLRRQGQPVERVEQTLRRYIDADTFKARCPDAYTKWAQAEELLWGADAEAQGTAIGHHCREAVQAFAAALVTRFQPPDCPSDPAKTVARLQAVIKARRSALASKVYPFLNALIDYWGTVSDLIVRQEHGALKEGEPLTPEDARRVVFQTLLVMVEVDRALST